MRNVFDALYEDGLLHIVSETIQIGEVTEDIYKSTAIAVNLYYKETLNYYFSYIKNIPEKIDIYIISSNEQIWEDIERFACLRNNIFLLKKENRGRDISSLLVTFKNIAFNKKYICFIHDKKEIHDAVKEDTKAWIDNLWGNTLKSEVYINNILNLFQEKKIGVLVPPKPIENKMVYSYINLWDADFEMAKSLADKMKLNCDMNINKSPITLGTVFWCKTAALSKLWKMNWSYEDFPEEPLPLDGTINHAIERIIAYVAQDAGYTTEVIMNTKYSEKLLLKFHKTLYETYDLLKSLFNIKDINDLKKFEYYRADVEHIFARHKSVYLYGAGEVGVKLSDWIKMWGFNIDGFLMTKKNKIKYVNNIPVYELQEICNDDSVGIIVSVGERYIAEVTDILLKNKFSYYYVLEK